MARPKTLPLNLAVIEVDVTGYPSSGKEQRCKLTFTNIACDILPRRAPYAAKPIRLNIFAFLSLSLFLTESRGNKHDYVTLTRPKVDISTPADHERTRPALHSNGDQPKALFPRMDGSFRPDWSSPSREASRDGIIWKVTLRPRSIRAEKKMEKVFSISFLFFPPLPSLLQRRRKRRCVWETFTSFRRGLVFEREGNSNFIWGREESRNNGEFKERI